MVKFGIDRSVAIFFDSVVRGAKHAHRKTRRQPDDLNVALQIPHVMAHLFAGSQRGKIRKCRRKGNASLRRNPRGHTHQILLSNPHVDIAFGERVG
ncbi:Uncharacterised protein [Lelliottia amnigena]|nr:Uncharacterised protein [Lelliottia amnigena]